jgi:hypothetical protein
MNKKLTSLTGIAAKDGRFFLFASHFNLAGIFKKRRILFDYVE